MRRKKTQRATLREENNCNTFGRHKKYMIKTIVFVYVKRNVMYVNALRLLSVNCTVFLGNRILSN